MKTSNKLLLVSFIIILGYLVVYDFSLRAEYLKGTFKDSFYGKTPIAITNFDGIEDNAANSTYLTIEQGPKFAIWIDKNTQRDLIITKNGKTLNIDYKTGVQDIEDMSYEIHVICPNLTSLTTRYKSLTGLRNRGGVNTITGFTQDSMKLEVSNQTFITLTHNTINNLTATVNSGLLSIVQTNTINTGNFDIKSDGHFTVLDAEIKKANYQFADSSTISLTGKALRLFRH
jgi:hypothetical protein